MLRLLLVLLAAVLLATALVAFLRWGKAARPIAQEDGITQVSTVKDAKLAVYDGRTWDTRFWNGINLGDTLPGHAPGELAPTREDYMRWFPQMKAMNVDVLRVYTILEPEFYEALSDFNSGREDPLWLIQGVWSPEEELTGEDLEGRDAYTPHITETFENEVTDAVHVVHGDADLPKRRGHASGRYRADVSEYMLGWIVGTEWFAYAVKKTDDANEGMEPFSGEYFRATPDATPFESWCASMLEVLAEEEMDYGWQHPVAISNWPTTDPLSHPDEANEQEDLVPVDPMHVGPTGAWKAGYFASYHIYPAYPDFMRHEQKYQGVPHRRGHERPLRRLPARAARPPRGHPPRGRRVRDILGQRHGPPRGPGTQPGDAHRGGAGRGSTPTCSKTYPREGLRRGHPVLLAGRVVQVRLEHGDPGRPGHAPADVAEPPDQRAELRRDRHRTGGERRRYDPPRRQDRRLGETNGRPGRPRGRHRLGDRQGARTGSPGSRKAGTRTST